MIRQTGLIPRISIIGKLENQVLLGAHAMLLIVGMRRLLLHKAHHQPCSGRLIVLPKRQKSEGTKMGLVLA